MELKDIKALADRIQENVSKVIVGKPETTQHVLIALLASGHILLEDLPGLGKTLLAKSVAKSIGCEFKRTQFTPDLLPSDITGINYYSPKEGEFKFRPGSVFTNIMLADEINRATPRTQSALLECMSERQVTEGGITYKLEDPFLVIATQNPVETQGTFPLPEAQLDRFLMRLSLGYPTKEESVVLMQRFIRNQPLAELTSVATQEELTEAAALCSQCDVCDDLMAYMISLCEAARNPELVRLGPSPRALLALMKCCQALAAIRGRDYVTPDDVKDLAVPVLAHRIILRGIHHKMTPEQFLRDLLNQLPVPTEERV